MTKPPQRRTQRIRIVVPQHRETATTPGTIEPPEGAPRPHLYAMAYGPDKLEEHALDSTDGLRELAGRPPVLWLNIDGVGDAATFQDVGTQFGLHALALEDVVNLHQRPKAEDYDDHAYVVVKMPHLDEDTLYLEQVSLFFGEDFVITVQERAVDCLEPVRQRIRKMRGRLRTSGADYLAYSVMDAIVDAYFPIVDRLNSRLDGLETRVLQAPDDDAVAEVHGIRHDLHALRRALVASREAVGLLARGETGPVQPETCTFLRDCQDHTAQLLDAVDACRELSAGLMELHQSSMSSRMNEIMKVLTLIATLFIPLGFIAGLYGMNFDRKASVFNMPELRWRFGYPFALGLMLATTIGLLLFFRRRGWLGRPRSAPPLPPAGGPGRGKRSR